MLALEVRVEDERLCLAGMEDWALISATLIATEIVIQRPRRATTSCETLAHLASPILQVSRIMHVGTGGSSPLE